MIYVFPFQTSLPPIPEYNAFSIALNYLVFVSREESLEGNFKFLFYFLCLLII